MFVLIAGGDPSGAQLAALLVAQDHQVRLIEHRREVLAAIHHELPTEVIYEGIATDPRVLEQAGIRQATVLVACTPSDADNLVLCYLAHALYGVRRSIGQINNPRHAWLFDDTFHVDVALNEATILAQLIEEEMSLGDMLTLLKLRRGQYSLIEVRVPEGARVVGLAIKDLPLPEHCLITAIFRQGEVVLPRGPTVIQVDDAVLVMTDRQGAEQLAALFVGPQQGRGSCKPALTLPAGLLQSRRLCGTNGQGPAGTDGAGRAQPRAPVNTVGPPRCSRRALAGQKKDFVKALRSAVLLRISPFCATLQSVEEASRCPRKRSSATVPPGVATPAGAGRC